MLNILLNNYCRMLKRLPVVIIMTVVTLVSILLAVYITGIQQVKGRIAFVSQSTTVPASSKSLCITALKKEPAYSTLVKQQYDAIVIDKGKGIYKIKSLRNAQFKSILTALLKNPDAHIPAQKSDRGVGVNIVGFMLMFLLMGTFANLFTFADDKEQGQLSRVVVAPVSLCCYLAAQYLYCISMFLPYFLMLAVLKIIGFNIGFTLPQYALLLTVIATLGIAFAMLLNTFIKKPDNASMLGNTLLTLTTVLSGSFYSFSKNNKIFDTLIKILPQKQLLDFAQHIQNGDALSHSAPIFYILAISALLFIISFATLKRRYVKKM